MSEKTQDALPVELQPIKETERKNSNPAYTNIINVRIATIGIKGKELPLGNDKKLFNLLTFKEVWRDIMDDKYGRIRDLAIDKYIRTKDGKGSQLVALEYAIDSVINELIHELTNKRTDEICL